MSTDDLSGASLLDLFRIETETQAEALTAGLLILERRPADAEQLEICMRAAHSLKGAARIVDRPAAVGVAHAMEDCFTAAQGGKVTLTRDHIDRLLRGVDLLGRIARLPDSEAAGWAAEHDAELTTFARDLSQAGAAAGAPPPVAARLAAASAAPPVAPPAEPTPAERAASAERDRVLRVTADNLNRLLGLAGAARVESTWLKPFGESVLRLKRLHHELGRDLDRLRDAIPAAVLDDEIRSAHLQAQRRVQDCVTQLGERLAELEQFDRRQTNLAHRLYREAIAVRMRPFADGVPGFARMVRDLAHALGKEARLEIEGEDVSVDRDILERLEAPLTHLLRNAVDHGIEAPAQRAARGKPGEGVIRLEARHVAGRLQITVSDDGEGVDLGQLRRKVVARGLTSADTGRDLSEAELLEFLFLPGFSLRETVTEISGRGVGLDVVQSAVKALRGVVRVASEPGRGVRFQLQLPLTLSVVRALLVEIANEPYAIPLAAVVRTAKVPLQEVRFLEGRQHFDLENRSISLVDAHQVLGAPGAARRDSHVPIVVVAAGPHAYGLAVDRLLGERELVVQPLDPRLGKLKDVAAAALMEDGAPVLILDTDDLVRSTEKVLAAGPHGNVTTAAAAVPSARRKRVLIVDDSLTVRELERKLLGGRGYAVDVAVDGMDGWNAVRTHAFDLVVTDIDMPRLDGFELVRMIKRDAKLHHLPVMIVSYKDREEDRQRGLDAGADYYLTKGSFHDETLLQAVMDLIGEPDA